MAGRYDKGPAGNMCSPGTATADQTGCLTITLPAAHTYIFSQLDPAEEIVYLVFRMS